MLITSFASFCCIIILNIYYHGEEGKPVPEIIQLIFFKIIGKVLYVRLIFNFYKYNFLNKISFVISTKNLKFKLKNLPITE
jgi:hypothetical protein